MNITFPVFHTQYLQGLTQNYDKIKSHICQEYSTTLCCLPEIQGKVHVTHFIGMVNSWAPHFLNKSLHILWTTIARCNSLMYTVSSECPPSSSSPAWLSSTPGCSALSVAADGAPSLVISTDEVSSTYMYMYMHV